MLTGAMLATLSTFFLTYLMLTKATTDRGVLMVFMTIIADRIISAMAQISRERLGLK